MFINFGPKTLPSQKFFVEMMGPIRGLDWPASPGSTCGWSYRSLVDCKVEDHTPLKGSVNHFVWGCFGKGSPHPLETAAKKTPIRWFFDLDHCPAYSTFLYHFVGSLLQWASQNSTFTKNQRCKRRRSMWRIPILGGSWITPFPPQKSILSKDVWNHDTPPGSRCFQKPEAITDCKRFGLVWRGGVSLVDEAWGGPMVTAGPSDPRWDLWVGCFFEVDLRSVLCENMMKYM